MRARLAAWWQRRRERTCSYCMGFQHSLYDMHARGYPTSMIEAVQMDYEDHRLTHPGYARTAWAAMEWPLTDVASELVSERDEAGGAS